MKYQICKRCVMDTSDVNIKFDKKGYCNHCTDALKRKKAELSQYTFEEIIDLLKKEGKDKKYDCVIGLSGGIDSSYLAYILSKAGLRILGVHVDGGWNTNISNKNIKLLCKKCNIDLEIIKIDEKEMFALQKAYLMSSVINQDVPQDHAFFAVLYKYMMKHKIRYFISGHNWVSESITPLSWGYNAYDSINIKDIAKKVGNLKLKKYPLLSFYEYRIKFPYVSKIKKLRPLNSVNYDPNKALEILEKEIGFKYYGSKHCESVFTRLLQSYIQPKKYGFEKRRAHLSSMIISGLISRDEALKILKEETCSNKQIEEDVKEFVEKIGISRKEFDEVINNGIIKSHNEFKTDEVYNKLFNKIKKIVKR